MRILGRIWGIDSWEDLGRRLGRMWGGVLGRIAGKDAGEDSGKALRRIWGGSPNGQVAFFIFLKWFLADPDFRNQGCRQTAAASSGRNSFKLH